MRENKRKRQGVERGSLSVGARGKLSILTKRQEREESVKERERE